MASRVCVVDVPGMSRELLSHVPNESALGKWLGKQKVLGLTPSWPAVTCSVQATLTTGVPPAKHGIIANGLPTFRFPEDQAMVDASNFESYRKQISFWEQSNQFVQAPRFWQDANGKSKYKTALLFFQHSMPGFAGTLKPAADIVLTPKPDHGPDGKLVSLCWSEPRELVPQVFKELGPFPLMNYWGPMAGIASSTWISKAAAFIWQQHQPQLQFVYVPHLDYDLQRFGPNSPQATKAVQDLSTALEPLIQSVQADGGKLVLLSEYAIKTVSRSIQPNRLLAEAGLLVTRTTEDGNLIDYNQSRAFAMVDHQIAHVYTKDAASTETAIDILSAHANVRQENSKHRRAGDFMLEAQPDSWLDYRWWGDEKNAPPFATTVDIHRKPGYDPLELFFDPVARRITQNASLIRGSHGLVEKDEAILVGNVENGQDISATAVAAIVSGMLNS
jgi:predicted AlkP superfamily pyrophosphatase or phosphodiesterase